MRRIILVFSVIFLGIITITTGCGREKSVSIDELNKINDKIIEYFQTHDKYSNFSYNYVDEKEKVVVVGLIDNSKNEQKTAGFLMKILPFFVRKVETKKNTSDVLTK